MSDAEKTVDERVAASLSNTALTEQLLRQREMFLRFLAPRVGTEAAEDILQSCYLKLIEKPPQLRKEESIVSWFYSVLRNAMLDYFRRNATRSRAHEEFAAEAPVSYEAEVKGNICACLPGVLQTMKAEYRTALEDVDLEGESISDFAKAQGTTTNNASVRLHRARKAAAKRITQVCGACAEHKCLDCTCRRTEV